MNGVERRACRDARESIETRPRSTANTPIDDATNVGRWPIQ
jgi:hypothetical protein